eukprot:6925223-Pyramimonas_sp.AAC.1
MYDDVHDDAQICDKCKASQEAASATRRKTRREIDYATIDFSATPSSTSTSSAVPLSTRQRAVANRAVVNGLEKKAIGGDVGVRNLKRRPARSNNDDQIANCTPYLPPILPLSAPYSTLCMFPLSLLVSSRRSPLIPSPPLPLIIYY